MFDRKLLKSRAKAVLSTSYWQTFGTILIFSFASTFIANFFTLKIPPTVTISSPRLMLVFGITMLMRMIMQFAAMVFLTTPLQTGLNKYLLDYARGGVPGINTLAYAFRNNYKKILWVMLAKQLIIIAFTIIPVILACIAIAYVFISKGYAIPTVIDTHQIEKLTITMAESPEYAVISLALIILLIPAIIKIYDYYLVEYIVADDSSLGWREALRKSKQMMRGNRFSVFVLGLSFIGWEMLGILAFGIGTVFVTPYILATDAQLYLELSGKSTFEF